MPDSTQLQNDPNDPRREMALGRCLVEGDPEAMSRARRRRRKALGLSIAIESVLLAFLVAAPLFTSIAQPNFARPKDFQIAWGASHPIHSAARPSAPVHNSLNANTHPITFPTNLSSRRPEQAVVPEVEPTSLIAAPFPRRRGLRFPDLHGSATNGAGDTAIRRNQETRRKTSTETERTHRPGAIDFARRSPLSPTGYSGKGGRNGCFARDHQPPRAHHFA
jgi:hypothetical protein